MKNVTHALALLLLTATVGLGQTSRLEMPRQGNPLPVAKFDIANKIPEAHLASLPKQLPTFRYSEKPGEFPKPALQMLLDQSPFAGTNLDTLLASDGRSDNGYIRLSSEHDRNLFIVNPALGKISVQNNEPQFNSKTEIPPRDAVPSLEVVSNSVLHYAELFGISTNDMDRNRDGSIHVRRTEDTSTGHRRSKVAPDDFTKAIRFQYVDNRSAQITRSIGGRILWEAEDKIYLQLGINGRLLRFDLDWRPMEVVHTNSLLTLPQILDEIKKGNMLGDVMNEYPDDGIAKITLKDIRIDYYAPSARGPHPVSFHPEIFPVADIYAAFTSKSGITTEGGLYVPIIDAK